MPKQGKREAGKEGVEEEGKGGVEEEGKEGVLARQWRATFSHPQPRSPATVTC